MKALLLFEGVTLRRGGRLLFKDSIYSSNQAGAPLTGPNAAASRAGIRLARGCCARRRGRIQRAPLACPMTRWPSTAKLPLRTALRFWEAEVRDGAARTGGARGGAGPPPFVRQAKRGLTLARVAASGAACGCSTALNGLDADGAARLDTLIAAHRGTGGAVLAASHNPLPAMVATLELGHDYRSDRSRRAPRHRWRGVAASRLFSCWSRPRAFGRRTRRNTAARAIVGGALLDCRLDPPRCCRSRGWSSPTGPTGSSNSWRMRGLAEESVATATDRRARG